MARREFAEAMRREHTDIRNAHAPNRDYPVEGLSESAYDALRRGLITEHQYIMLLQNLHRR
jgi:hypothetical protein